MEVPKEKELPLHGSSPSRVQQHHVMVNPKYPLASSLPSSVVMQQSSSPGEPNGNGMARTTSRRRKASGGGQGRVENTIQTNTSEVPHAPQAPRAPPLSYDYSYPSGSPTSPTNNNLATFAARARAAPNDLIPGNLPESGPNTSSQISRTVRRGSINRPPGAVYLEIRGTERKSLPSPRIDNTSPQFSPNIKTPKPNQETGSSFPRRAASASAPSKAVEDPADSQSRSASRRVSTGTGPRAEWASDRSPLQKLEVKLNDISKEEKRARVEEAEQLLRKSKANGKSRDSSRQVDSLPSRRQSDRVSSAPGTGLNNEPLNSAANSPRQALASEDQKSSGKARRISERGEARGGSSSASQQYTPEIVSSAQPDIPRGAIKLAQPSNYISGPQSVEVSETSPVSGQQSYRALPSQTSKYSPAVTQNADGRGDIFTRKLSGRHQSGEQSDQDQGYQETRIVGQNETRKPQTSMTTKRIRSLHQPAGTFRKPDITNSPGFSPADPPAVDHINALSTQPVNNER